MLYPVPGFFSKRYHVNRLEVQVQHSPSVVAVHSCAQLWQYSCAVALKSLYCIYDGSIKVAPEPTKVNGVHSVAAA